ncbi:MAG: ABC transporter ATP-binding protein [Mobilitalea sp.]
MKQMLSFLKGYRKESILAPVFKMLEASFDLLVPLIMASIINIGIADRNTNYIIRQSGILVILGIIGLICSITAQYYASKAAVGYATALRRSLFMHIQSLGFSEMDTLGTSTLITRMTSDTNQVMNGLNLFLRLFLRSPFIVVGSLIMAFHINRNAAMIFVVVIPLLSLIVFCIMFYTMPLYKKVQEKLDQLMGITRENLSGVRVIRTFNKEQSEVSRFERANSLFTTLQQKVGRISGLMNPITFIIANLGIIAILYTGAINVNLGDMKTGDVIALVSYMSQILIELVKLANLIIQITKGIACAGRIQTIFQTRTEMEFPYSLKSVYQENTSKAVEFDQVSLTYKGAGENSLNNITFSVSPGQTIGIIGGTGSGKSSLINLIPRFYDATSGTITLFGKPVKEYSKSELRDLVGVVMQKALLFKGTIRSNLLLGNENAKDEELWQSLAVAQSDQFVKEKKYGLEDPVEQGGRNLSGGQKQRLTIARALIKNPKILILDDSSSALDYATDAALRKALRSLPKSMTVFIVSQRASSVMQADQILVLEDGSLVGMGTHEELLENCTIYKEIYDSQYRNGGDQ